MVPLEEGSKSDQKNSDHKEKDEPILKIHRAEVGCVGPHGADRPNAATFVILRMIPQKVNLTPTLNRGHFTVSNKSFKHTPYTVAQPLMILIVYKTYKQI